MISTWDMRTSPCSAASLISRRLPSVQVWTPLGTRFDDLRQIKTEEELDLSCKSREIGDKAFAESSEDSKARHDRA